MSQPDVAKPSTNALERVRAFIVTRNAPDLPQVLEAVLQQTRPPDELTVVAAGTSVGPEVLERFRTSFPGRCHLVNVAAENNLGQAVNAALELSPDATVPSWYWFLHDDSAPEPTALLELLRVGGRGGALAVVGPKQVAWDNPQRLLELGIEATRSAQRIPLNSAVEVDQGQHDGRADVLAVGTAGMFARADIWTELGGFDPVLGPFGDGLEYGRRVRRAGYRVVVAPKAVVRHRQQSFAPDGEPARSFPKRRFAQLYNWALALSAPACVALFVALLLWTPLRSLGRLVTRRTRLAAAEFTAYFAFLAATPALMRARRRLRREAILPPRALRGLELTHRQFSARRRLHRRLERSLPRDWQRIDAATALLWRRRRRRERLTLAVLLLVFAIVGTVFWYPYFGGVTGGNWANLPASEGTLWAQAWSPWVSAGVGAPGPTNPALPLLALVAAPFAWVGVPPTAFLKVIFVLAAPLAGWAAWGAARLRSRSLVFSVGASALWVAQPTFIGALSSGNLPGVLLWIGMPLVVIGLVRAMHRFPPLRLSGVDDIAVFPRYDSLTWGAVAGIGALLVASAAPGLLAFIAICAYVAALVPQPGANSSVEQKWFNIGTGKSATAPKRGPKGARLWAATVAWLPAAACTAPAWGWALTHLGTPRLAIEQLLNPQAIETNSRLGWLTLLANSSTSVTAQPAEAFMLVAGLAVTLAGVIGLLATVRSGARAAWAVRGGALLAVCGWALAGIQSSLGPRWVGAAMSLSALGWLIAASAGLPASRWVTQTRAQLQPPRFRRWRLVPGVAAVLAAGLSLSSLWIPGTASMEPQDGTGAPLVVTEAAEGPRRGRLLVVRPPDISEGAPSVGEEDALTARIDRAAGRQQEELAWGLLAVTSESVMTAERTLAESVATLAARPSTLPASELSAHAIELVLLPPGAPTETGSLFSNLNASAGFERIGTTDLGTMWRVRPDGDLPASLTIESASTRQVVPAGTVGTKTEVSNTQAGHLVLAEPADPGWRATFNSVPLEVGEDPDPSQGWRQTWLIPAGEGELTVRYSPPWRPAWLIASGVFGLILLVAVVPWRPRHALWLREGVADSAREGDSADE